MLSWLLIGAASAGDLVWKWGPEPTVYHFEALIETFHSFRYTLEDRREANAFKTELSFDAACTGSPDRKGWAVTCDLQDVAMDGSATEGDEEDLAYILKDLEQRLEEAHVQLKFGKDGRITFLDLEGVTKADQRAARVHEYLRQILRRMFATLDLAMPASGDDGGAAWRHRGSPLAFALLTDGGTGGGFVYKHNVDSRTGDDAIIKSTGEAVVQMTDTGVGSQTVTKKSGLIVAMRVMGQGRFDTKKGQLAYRELVTQGELTASSMGSLAPLFFQQVSWVGRPIEPGVWESIDPAEPIRLTSAEPEEDEPTEMPTAGDFMAPGGEDASETPATPETPETTETPATPETPETPKTPETPEPETPSAPETSSEVAPEPATP